MMETFELIARLRVALQRPPAEIAYSDWLDLVARLEASLEHGIKYPVTERKLMERLREGMSQVYRAASGGLVPDYGRATVPLKALETLVRERTTLD